MSSVSTLTSQINSKRSQIQAQTDMLASIRKEIVTLRGQKKESMERLSKQIASTSDARRKISLRDEKEKVQTTYDNKIASAKAHLDRVASVKERYTDELRSQKESLARVKRAERDKK